MHVLHEIDGAPPVEAPRRAGTSNGVANPPVTAPRVDQEGVAWKAIGIFGAGVALGAMLGAGAALLLAPASGFETRMRLARGARRARGRASDRLDAIEDRVRRGAKHSRRNLERKLTLARWRAQDAWEKKRYGEG